MAYFDTTSPAGVLSREITATRRFFGRMGDAFHHVLTVMAESSSVNQRLRKVYALQALSDEELAKRGIRREDIVRNVFSDMYHL